MFLQLETDYIIQLKTVEHCTHMERNSDKFFLTNFLSFSEFTII